MKLGWRCLLLFITTINIYSIAVAALSVNDQAHLLGGFAPQIMTPEAKALMRSPQWNQQNSFSAIWNREESLGGWVNMFSPSNRQLMTHFFARNLGPAYTETHNLLYLFGGPDVLFPNVLFPHLQRTVLVGMEQPGYLLNPSVLASQATLAQKMGEIATAYQDILKYSYYITAHMSSDLYNFGTTTMISVGLVAQGYQLTAVDPIYLNAHGEVEVGVSGSTRGVRIRYLKPGNILGEVLYFQMNLSRITPEFRLFIDNNPFETAYYKAASYEPQHPEMSDVNELVLNKVSHLVQGDDGIPLRTLEHHASQWALRLFGIYTPVSTAIFGGGYSQVALEQAYGESLCAAADARDKQIWQLVWHTSCRPTGNTFGFASLAWEGTMPFHYDYAAMSGPGTFSRNPLPPGLSMSWNEMAKWSNLLVADRKGN